MARFLRTDTNSSGGHSRLFNNLVAPAAPPPPPGVVYEPIEGYLTRPRDTVPPSHYKLSPPAVLAPAGPQFTAEPISVTLRKNRPARTVYRLRPPVVVGPVLPPPVATTLAPQRRGRPVSTLRLPVVVAPVLARRVLETLAPQRRGAPKSALRYTRIVATAFVAPPPLVHLSPSARQGRKATYDLAGPFVINALPRAKGRTATQFAQPPRIPTHSRLAPPAVITTERATYSGPLVTLAPSRVGRPKSRLLPVPAAFRPFRPAILHLAYAPTRARAKYRLAAPTVVAPVLARPVRVELAPQTRGVPKSILHPPTVVGPVLARPVDATLARIRPPRTLWVLRKPTDLVDQQDLGYVRTHLAYSLRGRPKPRLAPPTVVFPFFARPTDVTLARIRPPKTIVRLAPPTDTAGLEDRGYVEVTLAYSLRGTPKSVLRRPVVIDLRPQTYFITTTLAPSRFPEPKSILREPPKGTPQPAPLYPLFVTLAPQRRGKAKPSLRQTIYAAKVYAPVTITLAPSRFPRPRSILRKPTVVAPVLARREIIVLAPQRRWVPKSILRKPTVVAPVLARPVEVTLVRIRPARTLFRVEAPIVVNAFVARPARIELAPQRRGVAKSRLRQVVYGAKVYAPISVALVPSPRQARRPGARLAPPTVVRARFVASPIRVTLAPSHKPKPGFVVVHAPLVRAAFVAEPINVTLVRIAPPKRFYRLSPPAVVGAGIYFRGLQVKLAYSLRGKPIYRLTLTETQIVECYGIVVGFDFSAEVCGDTTGATVVGTTDTGSTVSGGDSAATVEGTSEALGTVCGEDTQREGCD